MKAPLAVSFALLSLAATAYGGAPFLDLKFDDALKKAAAEKKIVLVDFYTQWCAPCKRNDKNLWPDPVVQQFLDTNTVPLRIDADADEALSDRYHIGTFPSMVLIRPDGTEIDRIVGEYTPQNFIGEYKLSMSGDTTEKRARAAVAKSKQDLEAHYNLAELLRQKGSNPEALKEFLWCFDHLADNDAAAARLQFPMMNGFEIQGETYPPAQKSWVTLQSDLEKKALSGPLDAKTAILLGILNENMGHPEKSLAVFDKLPAKSRPVMVGVVLSQLVDAKRYKEVLDNSDPQDAFAQTVQRYQTQLSTITDADDKKDFQKDVGGKTLSGGICYFEALAGAGKNDDALALADKILQFNRDDGTRNRLVASATKAGNAALAEKLKTVKS